MYADYNFYTSEYMGSAIPETAFPAVERAASDYINYITHNRIKPDELPEAVMAKVKMAVCAVGEICYKQTVEDENPTVSSESVGNHSISYSVNKKGFDERQHEKMVNAKTYLHGTGLMYGGLR